MKWADDISAAQNACARLPVLLSKFYVAGRDVLSHEEPATLHQFRLRGKRVRYTLERFRPLYGPRFDDLLHDLKQAQIALGEINDCATARHLVGDPEFQVWLAERQEKLRDHFVSYWLNEFDAPGREQKWLDYLHRYAGSGIRYKQAAHNEHQSEDPYRQAE